MPYKPLTHEQFHTGLSGMGNDQKWSDMLNFRSQNGRTRAVPRKFVLDEQAGLHTVVNLGNQVNYVLGSTLSYIFAGNDSVQSYPLWRVKVTHATADDDTARSLPVRGHYIETTAKSFTVTLIKPIVTPETPEAPATPEIDCYGCCDGSVVTIVGTNKVEGGAVVAGGVVQIFQGGALVANIIPNGGGIWRIDLPIGFYFITIDIPGYHKHTQMLNVTVASAVDFLVTEVVNTVRYLQPGARLEVSVDSDGGPHTAETIGDPTINGIVLPLSTWTNDVPVPGGGTAVYYLSLETLLEIYDAQTGDDTYDFDVAIATTNVLVRVYDHLGVNIYEDTTPCDDTFELPVT